MKFEELKIGELYYDANYGLLIITELYRAGATAPQTNRHWNGEFDCGRYSPLRLKRDFTLYESKLDRIRLATDEQIEEYILENMTDFSLGEERSVVVYPDAVAVTYEDHFVYLNKKQALKLKEILAREIV